MSHLHRYGWALVLVIPLALSTPALAQPAPQPGDTPARAPDGAPRAKKPRGTEAARPAAVTPVLPAALVANTPACAGQAARYEGEKGFGLFVTRIGRVEVENPLRPLTPEVTRVLQVTIAGKVATAYGPDLTALRRGGPPGAIEVQLGSAIRWEASLPELPDPLTIVSEAGETLATLGFRECTEAPAVKAPPPEAAKRDRKTAPRTGAKPGEAGQAAGGPKAAPGSKAQTGAKTPPGFSLPQGAITE